MYHNAFWSWLQWFWPKSGNLFLLGLVEQMAKIRLVCRPHESRCAVLPILIDALSSLAGLISKRMGLGNAFCWLINYCLNFRSRLRCNGLSLSPLMHLCIWKTELVDRRTEREKFSTCLFTPQMATITRVWQDHLKTPSRFPMWVSGAKVSVLPSNVFPDALTGSWIRTRMARTWTSIFMGCWWHK